MRIQSRGKKNGDLFNEKNSSAILPKKYVSKELRTNLNKIIHIEVKEKDLKVEEKFSLEAGNLLSMETRGIMFPRSVDSVWLLNNPLPVFSPFSLFFQPLSFRTSPFHI